MTITDSFRSSRNDEPDRVDIDLAELLGGLTVAAPRRQGQDVDGLLLCDRLDDCYRELKRVPLPVDEFFTLVADLDAEAWRRLALAVDGLETRTVRQALPRLLEVRDVQEQIKEGLIGLARATPLLTLELLRRSPLRREEFARQMIARLGASVKGETAEQARERLQRLDYGRLLVEAERAKSSAQERLEYLRKLQAEQDRRQPRRGKWW